MSIFQLYHHVVEHLCDDHHGPQSHEIDDISSQVVRVDHDVVHQGSETQPVKVETVLTHHLADVQVALRDYQAESIQKAIVSAMLISLVFDGCSQLRVRIGLRSILAIPTKL